MQTKQANKRGAGAADQRCSEPGRFAATWHMHVHRLAAAGVVGLPRWGGRTHAAAARRHEGKNGGQPQPAAATELLYRVAP